jgi:hypothetical protein
VNFNELIETVWDQLGYQADGTRLACTLQAIRRGINTAYDECAEKSFALESLKRESSISLVADQSVYLLNDWVRRLVSLKTITNAHKIPLHTGKIVDHEGMRESTIALSSGPWDAMRWERTTTAAKEGTNGSLAEAGTAFTQTGGDDLVSAEDVGRMLRMKGERNDYKITVVGGVGAATIDRAHRGLLTGNGAGAANHAASDYSGERWQVGPPGRVRIKLLPAVSAATTLYFDAIWQHRTLINPWDEPEIPENFRHLLWKGCLKYMALRDSDAQMAQVWIQEYEAAMERYEQRDGDEGEDEEVKPRILSTLHSGVGASRFDDGAYRRGTGYLTERW